MATHSLDKAELYHDLSGLNALREQRNSPEALKAACQQFESFFTRELLKTMRATNEVLDDDTLLDSQSSDFFREMYDDQMAVHLSKDGALGLADLLYKQLGGEPAHDALAPPSQAVPERGAVLPAYAPLADEDRPLTGANPGNPSPLDGDWSAKLNYPSLGTMLTPPSAGSAPPPVKAAVKSPPEGDWLSRAGEALKHFAGDPSPAAFVKAVLPYAEHAAATLGVSARVLIAQAALETGWGKKIIGGLGEGSSKNIFNIKATGWDGAKSSARTLEFEGGGMVRKTESFRRYDSMLDSFNDYVRLIQDNPRYAGALRAGGDPYAYARALQSAGYATDPQYAQKINSIHDSELMVDALRSLDLKF